MYIYMYVSCYVYMIRMDVCRSSAKAFHFFVRVPPIPAGAVRPVRNRRLGRTCNPALTLFLLSSWWWWWWWWWCPCN